MSKSSDLTEEIFQYFSFIYNGGLFCTPFLRGPFCTVFGPPKSKKKRIITDSRKKMTKISDYVFFIVVIFLQKREIFAFFFVWTFKEGNQWVIIDIREWPIFCTKGPFFVGALFCTIFDVFRCKKGPYCILFRSAAVKIPVLYSKCGNSNTSTVTFQDTR